MLYLNKAVNSEKSCCTPYNTPLWGTTTCYGVWPPILQLTTLSELSSNTLYEVSSYLPQYSRLKPVTESWLETWQTSLSQKASGILLNRSKSVILASCSHATEFKFLLLLLPPLWVWKKSDDWYFIFSTKKVVKEKQKVLKSYIRNW